MLPLGHGGRGPRTTPLLTRNPCGDIGSYINAPSLDPAITPKITSPVLLVQGDDDALFPPPAVREQRAQYPNASVRYRSLPDTGHAFTFEAGRARLVRDVDSFLRANGL